MAVIIEFTPKLNLAARENFADFIAFCKKLKLFGDKLDWNSPCWDGTQSIEGIAGRQSVIRLWWSNMDCCSLGSRKPEKRVLLTQPFLDFARGYIIHEHGVRPLKGGYVTRLRALRMLERAMIELTGEADVVKLNSAIFNRALQLAEKKYASSQNHHSEQRALEAIVRFLNEKKLVTNRFSWKGWKRSVADWSVDGEAEVKRKRKLPSKDALCALGGIFHSSKAPADEIVSSIMAILIAAPDRISESFRLPVNCEDIGSEFSKEGIQKRSYGLRWYPSKGGKPEVAGVRETA
jgi:hypothetical protein